VVGSGPRTPAHWGQNAEELGYLVRAGLSPLEAIEAATATAPMTVGPQAPLSGLLAEGYDADVLALSGDPTLDVGILASPSSVTHVWRAGVLAKAPGTLPSP
jgi:imidazolonepropionase-like amidohydrolase